MAIPSGRWFDKPEEEIEEEEESIGEGEIEYGGEEKAKEMASTWNG